MFTVDDYKINNADAFAAAESSVEKFRKLLSSISKIGRQSSSSTCKPGAKSSQKAFGKELTELLLSKNGLLSFLCACNDLGGESFWRNSAALSSIAKLFATKPIKVKSAEKYYAFILHNLLIIFKNRVWTKRIALLFSLVVEEFANISPITVSVQIIDKIVRPFELLLERGYLGAKSSPAFHSNGLWTQKLDEAVWIAARWLEQVPSTGNFAFDKVLLKSFPFWMHLFGQASMLATSTSSTSNLSATKQTVSTFTEFIADLGLICQRLLNVFATEKLQAQFLLKEILLQSDRFVSYNYFKVSEADSFAVSSKIQIIGENLNENSPLSKAYEFKYRIKISILEEPLKLQSFVDFQFAGFESIKSQCHSKDNLPKFFMAMLSETFQYCKAANPANVPALLTESTSDDIFRFVPDRERLTDMFLKSEDSIFLPHYVLTLVLKSLSTFDFSDLALDEHSYLNFLQTAETIEDCYKNKFQKESLASGRLITTSTLETILSELDDTDPGCDVESALHGHSLIELAKALRRRDKSVFQNGDTDFEAVFEKLIEKLESSDSYIFLAAINALAELAYWRTEPYLGRMVDLFVDWEKRRKQTSKSCCGVFDNNTKTSSKSCNFFVRKPSKTTDEFDEIADNFHLNLNHKNKCEVTVNDKELLFRGKVGESLAKVARQLGDFSLHYFDQLCDHLLPMVKHSDELIRCSALSTLSDLIIACRGRYFDKNLQELILCISQILGTVNANALTRRGAIHLLRSMLISANNQMSGTMFELFTYSLAPVTAQLKRLWSSDEDHVVRLHAELALIEIEEAVGRSLLNLNF